MTGYRVSFFKHLLSSDGHPFKVLQRMIKIRHSKSQERAVAAAKHRFARAENVPEWHVHADACEAELEQKPAAKPERATSE